SLCPTKDTRTRAMAPTARATTIALETTAVVLQTRTHTITQIEMDPTITPTRMGPRTITMAMATPSTPRRAARATPAPTARSKGLGGAVCHIFPGLCEL
ncbi:hypothetical protein Moror_9429, partial [Moniliophthora roreri MCA 2997]